MPDGTQNETAAPCVARYEDGTAETKAGDAELLTRQERFARQALSAFLGAAAISCQSVMGPGSL